MEIICRPRGAGKTTELINKAAEEFLYIVCFSHEEAQRVAETARQLGKDIPQPITMDELINAQFHEAGVKGFLIDNGEALIKRLARTVPVKLVTFTSNGGDKWTA